MFLSLSRDASCCQSHTILKDKQDTGMTHLVQIMPATQNTLHLMLVVSHARACGIDFGPYGLSV